MAKLLVQESAGLREFELVDDEVHIGRELDNALRLADPSISRHHAVVRHTAAGFEIQDLQSSNGVLVNGTRLPSALLRDGDRVTLGQIQMTFTDPPAQPAPAEPLGTVRMDPSEMAKIQGLGTPAPPALPVPPVPPVFPSAPPEAQATARTPPPMGGPRPFTIAPAASETNPAPAFLQPWLPPVPDDARPTGERGDFGTRLLALLIDYGVAFLLGVALWILEAILMSALGRILGPGVLVVGCFFGLLHAALGIAFLLFWAWCWIKFGATPGKRIMKLRVVPEDDPEGRIDGSMAVLRILGHLANSVLLGLPYLMILGEERKGLQDILSKSIVIKVDR